MSCPHVVVGMHSNDERCCNPLSSPLLTCPQLSSPLRNKQEELEALTQFHSYNTIGISVILLKESSEKCAVMDGCRLL